MIGPFSTLQVEVAISQLVILGSQAAPGFDKPEGVVTFHTAANLCFKTTIEKDEQPKGIPNA